MFSAKIIKKTGVWVIKKVPHLHRSGTFLEFVLVFLLSQAFDKPISNSNLK